jgi:riboflavin synthase
MNIMGGYHVFSGIVETIGIITDASFLKDCAQFIISPQTPFLDLAIGDSVSVNGVCLTVTHFTEHSFSVTAVPETLRLTNLGFLTKECIVNLERSLKLNARLGGHYVQGHVDGVGEIIELTTDGMSAGLVRMSLPIDLAKYVVKKGYITIDGMSITVVDVGEDWFTVTFIPHTQHATIVNQYRLGSKVNLEVDIISKYVEKLLGVKMA